MKAALQSIRLATLPLTMNPIAAPTVSPARMYAHTRPRSLEGK